MAEIDALIARRDKLAANGKNTEGQGVLRKIERKIRNISKGGK